MGKRYFNYVICNPTFDVKYLTCEYQIIEDIIATPKEFKTEICKILKNIPDFEKYIQFLNYGKIIPKQIYSIYIIRNNVLFLLEEIKKYKEIKKYFENFDLIIKDDDILIIIEFIKNNFFLDECKNSGNQIINYNCDLELKKTHTTFNKSKELIDLIKNYLNQLIGKNIEYVKLHETGNGIINFDITIERSKILKNKLDNLNVKNIKLEDKEIDLNNMIFNKHSKTNNFISNDFIEQLFKSYSENLNNLEKLNKSVYNILIDKLLDYSKIFNKIINFIKILDFVVCKSSISEKYNYYKPTIEYSDNSFIKCEDLRHPLVEILNENEFYIPNDIELNSNGIIIFGCNASGKSTLIKSLGINLILAQSGFYVSSKLFIFYPYKNIFTRLVKIDNIFEGISSFQNEMYELSPAIENCDNRTLILGDELITTTECVSSKNIIITLLEFLSIKKSSFIFASHLHEMLDYQNVLNLINNDKLMIYHFDLKFSGNKISYDRKLKNGCGSKIYGIICCNYYNLPKDFIELLNKNKNLYFKQETSVLDLKPSKYNPSKLKNITCENCEKSVSDDIHHIYHQKNADKNGFIQINGYTYHKNHIKNLMAVCKECHLLLHT
jgi:DNA mismatch repair protein MutS